MKPNSKYRLPTANQLDDLTVSELREFFRKTSLGSIPKNASQSFLKGHLVWAYQAQEAGYNPIKLRSELLRKTRQANRRSKPLYKPGTRLIREWQGVVQEVTIEKAGFVWNGKRYRSLSQIARLITGTRWSGPRFFGLNEEKIGNAKS
jgi:hypothetical protein